MIGHIAAKYDVKMDDDDPAFIMVEMNQIALESTSREMEARILKSLDDRLNHFNPKVKAATTPVAAENARLGTTELFTWGVLGILIVITAIVAGVAGAKYFGGAQSLPEKFAALNNLADMMQCRGGQVQTFPDKPGEAWCVISGTDQNRYRTSLRAWRVQ